MTYPQQYKVYLTPLLNLDGLYGSEIEVTDLVSIRGLSSIRRELEANDYDAGVTVYDSITLDCINKDGYFNEETDSRSIFQSTRDRAKVRVVYLANDGTETSQFRGLVNEEATKTDFESETISFKVLSYDSIIKQTKITAGTILNGMTFKDAIIATLSQTRILAVITVLSGNINPELNLTIDTGAYFDNLNCATALSQLLQASNSVSYMEFSGGLLYIYVVPRIPTSSPTVWYLYGNNDEKARQNLIRITDYATGKARQFTSVKWGSSVLESSDPSYINDYGIKQKSISFDFITTTATKQAILDSYALTLQFPKIECKVLVPFRVGKDIKMLDLVSINEPYRLTPTNSDKILTAIDSLGTIGQVGGLPYENASHRILPNVKFRVIGILEQPDTFTILLKLRQTGRTPMDGYF